MSFGKTILPILASTLLSGCVVAWGAAHNVEQSDENGITVRYDPGLTSSTRAQIVAREHCKSVGKVSEAVSAKTSVLSGIAEEVYHCVPSQAAN